MEKIKCVGGADTQKIECVGALKRDRVQLGGMSKNVLCLCALVMVCH